MEILGFPVQTNDAGKMNLESIRELTGWVSVPEFALELDSLKQLFELQDVFSIFTFQLPAPELKENLPDGARLMVTVFDNEWPLYKDALLRQAKFIDHIIVIPTQDLNKIRSLITDISQSFAVLLSVSHIADVEEALTLPISGIALSGTEEIKPGLKDYQHLAGILESLEVE